MSTVKDSLPVSGSDRGSRWQGIGAVLFWLGLFGAPLSLAFRSALPSWAPLALVLLFTAVALAGVAMTRRGRKLRAVTRGSAVLQDDRRAPVVYLRPFSTDDESARVVSSWALLRFGYYTDEEQLAMVLNEIGPFVAIGDPRESLPDLGATRISVGGDEWQAKVTDLVSRAGLVIMRAGTSEGFWK